jgi:hypothetical protein
MRIRSYKPEFWTSEDVARLDWHTRLLFLGVWSYVDDNGVGRDNELLIVAAIFPLDDPREALAKVSRGLQQLAEGNLIIRYQAEDGKNYLCVTGWRHQRIDHPNQPRYPLPPGLTSEDLTYRKSRETLARVPENLAPGTEEQRNRGTVRKTSRRKSKTPDPNADREDVEKLCHHLNDRIVANGSNRKTVTKQWRDSARLLLDKDGRTFDQVMAAIDWCQNDEFWRSNILSMPKLRAKYDTLRMQAQTQQGKAKPERLTFGGGDTPAWEM